MSQRVSKASVSEICLTAFGGSDFDEMQDAEEDMDKRFGSITGFKLTNCANVAVAAEFGQIWRIPDKQGFVFWPFCQMTDLAVSELFQSVPIPLSGYEMRCVLQHKTRYELYAEEVDPRPIDQADAFFKRLFVDKPAAKASSAAPTQKTTTKSDDE